MHFYARTSSLRILLYLVNGLCAAGPYEKWFDSTEKSCLAKPPAVMRQMVSMLLSEGCS